MSEYEHGDPNSKICVIVEAPGKYEMLAHEPLVGPSGRVFDQLLHSSGLIRRELYILNVIPHQIKDIKPYLTTKGLTEDGLEYADALWEKLLKCGANVLIPMGNLALAAVTGKQQIMKWRGSILEVSRRGRTFKVIPTIHPAATLRGQYIWRYHIILDMKKAKREMNSPHIKRKEREFILNPSFGDIISFLNHCIEHEPQISFDIECYNDQVSCMAFAPNDRTSMCIPFWGKDWTLEEEVLIWSKVAEILENPDIRKLGQNLIFDIQFLMRQNKIRTRGPICDTMIAHALMYPDFPKGLDFLVSVWTDDPFYKDDKKLWASPWKDQDAFWLYNARDAIYVAEIWPQLEVEIDEDGYRDTYDMTIDMHEPLLYMMLKGIKVDREKLELTRVSVSTKLEDTEARLAEVSDFEFSPYSPKQCMEYFYGHKGIAPYINRKTGKPTTDDKAMQRIVRRYNLPEARLVQECRKLKKLLTTYLEVGIDDDGYLRCFYHPQGTWTGRLSSSQSIFGTGMNMQNLHPGFKGFLVAD